MSTLKSASDVNTTDGLDLMERKIQARSVQEGKAAQVIAGAGSQGENCRSS